MVFALNYTNPFQILHTCFVLGGYSKEIYLHIWETFFVRTRTTLFLSELEAKHVRSLMVKQLCKDLIRAIIRERPVRWYKVRGFAILLIVIHENHYNVFDSY